MSIYRSLPNKDYDHDHVKRSGYEPIRMDCFLNRIYANDSLQGFPSTVMNFPFPESERTNVLVANGLLTIETLTLCVRDYANPKRSIQCKADSRTPYALVKIAVAERFKFESVELCLPGGFGSKVPVKLEDGDPIGLAFRESASNKRVSLLAVKTSSSKNKKKNERPKSKDRKRKEWEDILRIAMEEPQSRYAKESGEARSKDDKSSSADGADIVFSLEAIPSISGGKAVGAAGYQVNGDLNEDEALSIALEASFRDDSRSKRLANRHRPLREPTRLTPSQPKREPPSQLVCPITMELMDDPVMAADGHTYERSAIERVFRNTTYPRSPVAGIVLESKHLIPNVAIRSMCREFLDKKP